MKTITERDGKNVNMQVVGDLHQYPDGSVHTVKEGKPVWEEGSGDAGYTVEETRTTVYDGTVTGETVITGVYAALLEDVSAPINTDRIFVTFNGIEYEALKRVSTHDGVSGMEYGGTIDPSTQTANFSEYPFLIQSIGGMTGLYMSTEGPNTLKVETVSETVTPTDEFKAAVNASVEGGVFVVGVTLGEGQTLTCDKTAEEIYDAFEAGQVVQFETPLDGAIMKSLLLQAGVEGTNYIFMFMYDSVTVVCRAESGSAYPSGTLSE